MKKLIIAGAALLPAMAFAQSFNYVFNVLDAIRRFVQVATPIIIGLAMLFFLYGLMKFILAAGDEEKRTAGKQIMIWGIVALFIMVSVWGLVQLIGTNVGVNPTTAPNVGGLAP